jgi:GTPase SAR1 family protein/predicted MPP superfamily phosphohydrolase
MARMGWLIVHDSGRSEWIYDSQVREAFERDLRHMHQVSGGWGSILCPAAQVARPGHAFMSLLLEANGSSGPDLEVTHAGPEEDLLRVEVHEGVSVSAHLSGGTGDAAVEEKLLTEYTASLVVNQAECRILPGNFQQPVRRGPHYAVVTLEMSGRHGRVRFWQRIYSPDRGFSGPPDGDEQGAYSELIELRKSVLQFTFSQPLKHERPGWREMRLDAPAIALSWQAGAASVIIGDSARKVHVVDAASLTSLPLALTFPEKGTRILCSPVEDLVAFAAGDESYSSNTLSVLRPVPLDSEPFAWSPDGQEVFLRRNWNERFGETPARISIQHRLLAATSENNIHVYDLGAITTRFTLTRPEPAFRFSFSRDERALAFLWGPGNISVVETEAGKEIAAYNNVHARDLDFSPTNTLAIIADNGHTLAFVELDLDKLLAAPSKHETSTRTAKVVLVGEGGVGKSSLAMRLVEDRFDPKIKSTHGMQTWRLPAEKLHAGSAVPGEQREVVLWDLGGQNEYRILHQLFLRDTSAALLLMRPRQGNSALDEVREWNDRLANRLGDTSALTRLLVGAHVDDEDCPIDQVAIDALLKQLDLRGPIFTSASAPHGINELKEAIAGAIDWSSLPRVTRIELYDVVHREIQTLQKEKRSTIYFNELEKRIRELEGDRFDADSFGSVVSQLARQGVIAETYAFSRAIMLNVEQVERYAGSIVVEARDNPRGFPAFDLATIAILGKEFARMTEEERAPRAEERLILECVVGLMIESGICIRQGGQLIFPSLFPAEDRAEIKHAIALSYDVYGAIDHIYASLVSELWSSGKFGALRLQGQRAEMELISGDLFGVRSVYPEPRKRSRARLELFFGDNTEERLRELFVAFVEQHLQGRGIGVVERFEIQCECGGYTFSSNLLQDRLRAQKMDVACPACDRRTPITLPATEAKRRDPKLGKDLIALKMRANTETRMVAGETKFSMAQQPDTRPSEHPIRILHLTDLHVKKDADTDSVLQPLIQDLRDQDLERLDYVVISGDITNIATAEEFSKAREIVGKLLEQFHVAAERAIIVPGNHDQSWDVEPYNFVAGRKFDPKKHPAENYYAQGDGFMVRDDAKYALRFKAYNDHFYHPLLQRPYSMDPKQQFEVIDFPDTRVQFLELSSSHEIDEHYRERSSINDSALSAALLKAADPKDRLRIAVWHHPITGNEKIQNDAFVERLRKADFRLCLHGHVHEDRADHIGYQDPARSMYVVGCGSLNAPAHDRPESMPRLYNLLEIERDHSKIKVITRHAKRRGGAFEPWYVWPGEKKGEKLPYYFITFKR